MLLPIIIRLNHKTARESYYYHSEKLRFAEVKVLAPGCIAAKILNSDFLTSNHMFAIKVVGEE